MLYRMVRTDAAQLVARGLSFATGNKLLVAGVLGVAALYGWGKFNAVGKDLAHSRASRAEAQAQASERNLGALRDLHAFTANNQVSSRVRIGVVQTIDSPEATAVLDLALPDRIVPLVRWEQPPARASTD